MNLVHLTSNISAGVLEARDQILPRRAAAGICVGAVAAGTAIAGLSPNSLDTAFGAYSLIKRLHSGRKVHGRMANAVILQKLKLLHQRERRRGEI